MSKDTYYLKLDLNSFEDNKIKVLGKRYGRIFGFGGFFFITLKLRQEDNCRLGYDDITFEGLSEDMQKTAEEVREFVDTCIKLKLFTRDGEMFCSERLNRDVAFMNEKREKNVRAGKISAEKRYGKPAEKAELPPPEPKPQPKPPEPKLEGEALAAAMVRVYEERTGKMITPNDAEILKDIAKTYPLNQFSTAVDEAVLAKAQSPMRYVAKVLENWATKKEVSTHGSNRGYSQAKGTKLPDRNTGYTEAPADPELDALAVKSGGKPA